MQYDGRKTKERGLTEGVRGGKRRVSGERERTRGVHLFILLVMTLTFFGMSSTALFLDWELWIIPFLTAGVVLSWILHIRQRYTERTRLYLYASVIWALVVYHGVHVTSFQDLAAIAAIEFALFALTDETRIVDIGFAFFWFCFFWDLAQILQTDLYTFDALMLTRIELYVSVVITTYFVARYIVKYRSAEREADEEVIRELSETKGRTDSFLVHVSHAFRTPVNVVSGISSALLSAEEDAYKQTEMRHVAESGADLSIKLDDLLDYTELETGRFLTEQEPYMLASVINDVLAELHLYTRETSLDIVIDVDADLPATLRGDARRIRKVLFHVLDNAVKYTKRGGVYIHIYREDKPYGMNLCMDIRDTGGGMSGDMLSHIREGTYHTETEGFFRSEGFGLGLQIVYGIVHAMDGFVRIESARNRGTHVHVSIPQEIVEDVRCMDLADSDRFSLVFFQGADQFRIPAVREYYTRFMTNMVRAFSLTMRRVLTLADLQALLEEDRENTLTHVLIGENEYREAPDFFDALAKKFTVVLAAGLSFAVQPGSAVTVFRKPVSSFLMVQVLRSGTEPAAGIFFEQEGSVRFDGVHALVIDDEEMNLIVAKRILSEYGIQTALARSGREGVFLARSNEYDIIFVDHLMPEMDGIACAQRIRDILMSEGRRVKIVALTANVTSDARRLFAREGFDGFVSKPVIRTELERELRRVLQEKGPENGARMPASDDASERALRTEREAYGETELSVPEPVRIPVFDAVEVSETADDAAQVKHIAVTIDSAVDLPEIWIRRYGIDVICHILHTDSGTFYDNREIDSDELIYYMRDEGHLAKSEVPDASAFKAFFAGVLEKADNIVHLSIAEDASPAYPFAKEASRHFDQVHVFDTGSMSGGAGLTALYAAHLARTDIEPQELLARLEQVKRHIVARFALENTAFLLRGGRMTPLLSRWMDAFLMHPTINMKNDKMKFSFAYSAQYRRHLIHRALRGKRRIDTSLLMITHAGLTMKELGEIQEEVERIVHFDRVAVMRTSSAIAVNVGPGTFGLMFHTLSDDRDTGDRLFDFLPD